VRQLANFSALAAARHAVLKRAGWNVEADGLFGAPPITVIVGAEVHPSVTKSLGLLGLGRTRLIKVPVDAQGRMRVEALPSISDRTIVIAQAGNVNTGAFDPFSEICERAHQAGAWVHVDGAFGLWAAAAPATAKLTTGMVDADSWATDLHKWLTCRMTAAWPWCATADALRAAMAITAEYLPPPARIGNPIRLYARAVATGARRGSVGGPARIGPSGRIRTDRTKLPPGQALWRGLQAAGYKVLNDVVLNQVLVSFGMPTRPTVIISDIQTDGNLLVRRYGLAGSDGDADQRFLLGHHRCRCPKPAWKPCCGSRERRTGESPGK